MRTNSGKEGVDGCGCDEHVREVCVSRSIARDDGWVELPDGNRRYLRYDELRS